MIVYGAILEDSTMYTNTTQQTTMYAHKTFTQRSTFKMTTCEARADRKMDWQHTIQQISNRGPIRVAIYILALIHHVYCA